METIEALAPGLYEMKIEEQIGEGDDARFLVSFHERTMNDILRIDENGRGEEPDFAPWRACPSSAPSSTTFICAPPCRPW